MTHWEYLEEPIDVVDWALSMTPIDARLEKVFTQRAIEEARHAH